MRRYQRAIRCETGEIVVRPFQGLRKPATHKAETVKEGS